MNCESLLTSQDKEVLDIIDRASVQYEKYLELNKLNDLSDLFEKPKPIIHNWNRPLDITWRED